MYIRVHPADNVAIVVNAGGLPAGRVRLRADVARIRAPGAQSGAGRPGRRRADPRYGETIGMPLQAVPRGCWMAGALMRMPAPPALDGLSLATGVRPAAAAGRLHVRGIPQSGRIGGHAERAGGQHQRPVRRRQVEFAVQRIREELLPRYPNVDGVVGADPHLRLRGSDQRPGAASRSGRCAT